MDFHRRRCDLLWFFCFLIDSQGEVGGVYLMDQWGCGDRLQLLDFYSEQNVWFKIIENVWINFIKAKHSYTWPKVWGQPCPQTFGHVVYFDVVSAYLWPCSVFKLSCPQTFVHVLLLSVNLIVCWRCWKWSWVFLMKTVSEGNCLSRTWKCLKMF